MIKRLTVRPEAEREIVAIAEWYEEQRDQLGKTFVRELNRSLDRILSFPELVSPIQGSVRRWPMNTFPYSIFYVSEDARVVVLAVLHQARDPRLWPRK